MTNRIIKVYNIYNCQSEDNSNNEKEIFDQPSLVDFNEPYPTLQQYVDKYILTGALPPRVGENDIDEDSDDYDFNSPLYDKDADVEDLTEYQKSILEHDFSEKKSDVEKVSKENKEKIADGDTQPETTKQD